MIKKITIIFCLPLVSLCVESLSSSGVRFVNPTVFNIENAVSMEQAIKRHATKMEEIAPFMPYVSIPGGRWKGPKEKYLEYAPLRDKLFKKGVYDACGTGFLIGALAAVANNLIDSKTVDKRILAGTLLSSIAAVFYQNHAWGKIPYYSADAKLCDNLFEDISGNSAVRCLLSLVCAGFSFFGTKYALDRAAEHYAQLKNNSQEDPLNQLL